MSRFSQRLSKTLANVQWLGFHLNIIVISGVLLGSIYIQFGLGAFPCPLCTIQRMTMLLCGASQAYIVTKTAAVKRLEWNDLVFGEGLTLLMAVTGACFSLRHIISHIAPEASGYGPVIFGLHTYSWALLVFAAEIMVVAINLLLVPNDVDEHRIEGRARYMFSQIVLGLFLATVAAMAVSTFILEGLHWTLPEHPDRNEFLYDIGVKLCSICF